MTDEINVSATEVAQTAPVVTEQPQQDLTEVSSTDSQGDVTQQAATRDETATTEEALPKSVKKRLDSYAWRAKQAEEEIAQLKQRFSSQTTHEDPNAPKRPRKEEFVNPIDYVDAVEQWRDANSNYQSYKQQQSQTMQYLNDINTRHNQRLAEAAEEYDDFHDVIGKLNSPSIVQHPNYGALAIAIQESPKSAALHYYLAKNQAEAQRLLNLNPIAAASEIGRLEARVTTPAKNVTKAPTPAKRIAGEGKGETKMSMENARKRAWLVQHGKL